MKKITTRRRKSVEDKPDNRNSAMTAALERSESEKLAILQGLRGLVTVRYLDPELRILWDNADGSDLKGGDRTASKGYCYKIIRGRTEPCTSGCTPQEALEDGEMKEQEAKLDDGRIFIERSNPVRDNTGAIRGVVFITLNITKHKRAEQELTKQEAEIGRKSRQLAETNTALRVLLRQQEGDQRELEERIVANVNQLVLPYVRKLKGMRLNDSQMSYMEVVETNLLNIVAPFLRQVVSQFPHMTTQEIQVAALVKDGKSNKEIAELMSISVNTVESHRHNLRKNLGLQKRKINLRSYLLSLNRVPKGRQNRGASVL
ncbi:MAG: LuxR C-terminal-related transcriptional regulator [Thermodesulfobacteriota bacterium]